MFRESDYVDKRPHKSNQPVPIFQALSRASRLDDGQAEIASSRNVYMPPEIVPTTFDTRVDPTNRDADWAGLVPRGQHRRHNSNNDHRSQITNLRNTEEGIIPCVEERYDYKRRDNHPDSNHGRTPLIGGTGAQEVDQWKTNSQRMESHEPTSRDQLVLHRRALVKRQITDPIQANFSRRDSINGDTPEAGHRPTHNRDKIASGGLVSRNGSMLSNIGQSIVTRLPTNDSLSSSNREQLRPKTLIVENYRHESGFGKSR
mmetsp:Transcript_21165/g.20503  ORF Transcript_21165/g.20503 Transcript_21165/m.20503 type:complete len:259 (+) Transcript_21165:243-1019(+)|eukprot:CAMPEP_0119035348 /NCGR_PEP_ID=MMETSP1177-20130426/2270_1 /TAXON_ID=2985 /ORGANISM="Ochromonas sp, Strain CCMP1899" /LENGTH=258 /DNA_ID=CAMNT_0006993417 /DNA_START=243 /DNA_END=1019 /DNA_ORIENTATION=-